MRRGPQRDWLTTDGADPIDPDILDDRLKELMFPGCVWDKIIAVESEEVDGDRLDMKVYVARYTGVSPEYWDGREVADLRRWFEATCDLVKRENEAGKTRD